MINMKTPCMTCKHRELGCHGKCDDYKAYKEELDRIKKLKDKDEEINKYVSMNLGKARRCKESRNYGLND